MRNHPSINASTAFEVIVLDQSKKGLHLTTLLKIDSILEAV